MNVHAHVLTTVPPIQFSRMTPQGKNIWGGVRFTYGLNLPQRYDVLIVYSFNKYTIKPNLPFNQVAYVSGEPMWFRDYNRSFLNQFRCVIVSGHHKLKTVQLKKPIQTPWLVGISYNSNNELIHNPLSFDEIINWNIPKKDNQISIVTSKKTNSPDHKLRLQFINHLKQLFPDQIQLYGREFNPVADKKDAILPHKYHLALENNTEPWGWTEKLADPILCYSLPFYYGSTNAEEEIPSNAFIRIDPTKPEEAVKTMLTVIERDEWANRIKTIKEAREKILFQNNIMAVFAQVAKLLIKQPKTGPQVTIRPQASLPPNFFNLRKYFKLIYYRTRQQLGLELEVKNNF